MRTFFLSVGLLASSTASAQIAEECQDYKMPKDYNEIVQYDFLQNYFALVTSFSAVHGPLPHEPGHGAIGLDLAVMPPLGCAKRTVLNGTKTEDTNKTPIIPRPRASFAFPAIGPVVPWGGFAYVPPVKMFGTTNVIMSAEIGFGVPLGDTFQLGARFHATSQKTVGEIAEPFDEKDEPVDDLYLGSTLGFDLMTGLDFGVITPFVALGLVDASSNFYIGDDGVITNNYHPYLGPAFSLGAEGLIAKRLRWGAELYAAPGGYSMPDDTIETLEGAAQYGNLTTARMRLAYEL